MPVGEDGVGREAPVVVEDPAAADDDEVGAARGVFEAERIAPEDRLDAVGLRGRLGIARGDRDRGVRRAARRCARIEARIASSPALPKP